MLSKSILLISLVYASLTSVSCSPVKVIIVVTVTCFVTAHWTASRFLDGV